MRLNRSHHLDKKTPLPARGSVSFLCSVLTVAFVYFVAAHFILSVPAFSGQTSPVWPSAGIALAALVVMGRRVWPGVIMGAFLIDYAHNSNLLEALVSGTGGALQAIAGASLLQWLGIRPSLPGLRDVVGLIGVGGFATTLISSTLSIGILPLTGSLAADQFLPVWSTFWLGNSIGILIVTPLLLLFTRIRERPKFSPSALLERGIWLVLLVVVTALIFCSPIPPEFIAYPIEYGPYPLLVWAALRFSPLMAVVGSGVVSFIAVWGVLNGGGPFLVQVLDAGKGSASMSIFPLQIFMGMTSATTLFLATAVRQQRTTQKLLRRNEASLLNAQRIARIGHWDYLFSTGEWYGSAELYRLLGIAPGQVESDRPLKTLLLDAIHPEDRDRIQLLLEQAIYEKRPYTATYRLQLSNEQERYVTEQVDVNDTGVTGTVQDITLQRQAEQALRESEEKFSKAFGFSPDAITIGTLDQGLIIDANDSFLKLSGYQRDEVLGKTVAELNLWSNISDRQWLIEQIHQQRQIRNHEFEFRSKSGQSILALVSVELIALRGEPHILLVARDVTEKKRADERLRLANERDRLLGEMALHIRQTLNLQEMLSVTVCEVRQLLQAGRVFICRFDDARQGTVVAESVLPSYSSLMGEKMEESVYTEIHHAFEQTPVVTIENTEHLDDFPCLSFLEECVQRFQVKAALGVPIEVDDRLYGVLVAHNCDTPRLWQPFEKELLERLATQVAIAIQQGQLYTQVQQLNTGLEKLVTERTQQLEQKMTELQEMNQLRDMFLHAVSHDLRTTVMGNLMVLRNLQQQPQNPVYLTRPILDRMIQAGDCQLNKLCAFQEAYQMKTEGFSIEPAPIQLNILFEEAIAELSPLLDKNHATVDLTSIDEVPEVWADPTYLKRVIHQLLKNAVIHNPPQVAIDISLTAEDDYVKCTVSDNGVGIAQELCDRLFQFGTCSSKQIQLTGISLGLYLCRQVVSAHGGTIAVSSTPQQGTSVSFSLHQASKDSNAQIG